MVFAANDVGDAEIDVVDDARQQIEPAAVLAPDHRVAQQTGVEALLAADKVGEDDWLVMVELEPPVRRASVWHRRIGGLSLINPRQAAAAQHPAAQRQLPRGPLSS